MQSPQRSGRYLPRFSASEPVVLAGAGRGDYCLTRASALIVIITEEVIMQRLSSAASAEQAEGYRESQWESEDTGLADSRQ